MSASPSPPPQAATDTQTRRDELYNQVFGEGSDVSDLSDDEAPPARRPFPSRPAGESTTGAADDEEEEEGEEDEDDDERDEDAYVPGTTDQAARIPRFKKVTRTEDDEDEAGEGSGGEERRMRRKKKRRIEREGRKGRQRAVRDEEEDEVAPVYDEATQRRMELEARIDNIGKKAKVVRRKKKGDDVDIVDSYYDDICARLRDRMMVAAEKDKASNIAKLPATAKLAMLDEVMSTLRNTTLWQSIVDNGVLDAVRAWLEPIDPTGALPAVGIQNAIFEVLPKMDLDTTTLKESRLGPIVLFYTKTKRVTPSINRAADALVQAWSRPIIKRPANFRSRQLDMVDGEGEDGYEGRGGRDGEGENGWSQGRGGSQQESQSQGQGMGGSQERRRRFDARKAIEENRGRKGARMPVIKEIQYTVAPESRTQHHAEDLQHVSRIQLDNRKFNKFARQMKASRAR